MNLHRIGDSFEQTLALLCRDFSDVNSTVFAGTTAIAAAADTQSAPPVIDYDAVIDILLGLTLKTYVYKLSFCFFRRHDISEDEVDDDEPK